MSEHELTIDCANCVHESTSTCDDCIVSYLLSRDPGDAIVIDAEEARAMRMLEKAGLVPALRHERRVG
ncbi:MAG: hypothetical protein WB770_05455 [Acidimicrobiales bacterium]